MIRHIKRHYAKLQLWHKGVLGSAFIIGTLFGIFSSIFATLLPFENSLPTLFSGMDFSTGNYSEVHFAYGGNDFAGIIFWLTGETLGSPQNITINGGSQSINCTRHLRGLYYNNMRGWRIRPLDTGSLAILSGQGSGYTTLTMTGGFYTNCSNVSGYPSVASNEIYGYIGHTRSGVTMQMIAGVNYNFSANTLSSGSSFAATLVTTGGTYSGRMRDNYGGIAEISSGQAQVQLCGNGTVDGTEECDDGNTNNGDGCSSSCAWEVGFCDGFTLTPAIISTGQNITFTCSGHSISGYTLTGYILTIFSGINNPIYTSQVFTSVNTYTWITGSSLPIGNYTGACTVIFNQGVGPQCPPQLPFSVSSASGCLANFQGDVTPANVYHLGGITYYTNQSGVTIHVTATYPTYFSIAGDFLTTPITGNHSGSSYLAYPITLTQINSGINLLQGIFSTGSCIYTGITKQIYVDTLAPGTPTLISPISGTGVCSTGNTIFSRTAVTDSGVGLSGYRRIFTHASGTVYSGVVSSGSTGASIAMQNMTLGNYTWKVEAFDLVGNTSTSATGSFVLSPNYCGAGVYGSGIQIIGTLSSIIDAELEKVYSSEIFYVRGLTGSTLISIDLGTLIVNGTGIGTTGMITSQTPLRIELISSDEYDETVTSDISVAGITGSFSVTTKENACNLSRTQKLAITRIYELIKDEYDDTSSLLDDFLATFQSMLEDEVDITEDCTLEYLLELINDDLDNLDVDTSNHIAPNCKEYQISYDNSERAYYSPNMKNRYYFINRETLIRHIDFYNPGDCHINTYGNASWSENRNTDEIHVAPNGKIYHLQVAGGGYTSSDFMGNKYFDSFEAMTSYIDRNNPAKDIRNHQVDRSFTPITYVAPNSKEYRIYKTNRGYMSYKLMKVIYFDSLSALQHYINRNNPAR